MYSGIVEPLFSGLAAENEGLRKGMATPEMQNGIGAHLQLGQTRETELDLPTTMARIQAMTQ